MAAAENGSILIGGTGRAGTSLLVQIFTHLGFNTGFSLDEALRGIDPISRGGLEHRLWQPNLPHVIKSPALCHDIAQALASGFKVEAAIIPVRDLSSAAESRTSIARIAERRGADPFEAPGGLVDVTDPADQEAQLAVNFYRFLQPLIAHDITPIFLDFRSFIGSASYTYIKLFPVLSRHGVTIDRMTRAYADLVRPDLVGRSRRLAEEAA